MNFPRAYNRLFLRILAVVSLLIALVIYPVCFAAELNFGMYIYIFIMSFCRISIFEFFGAYILTLYTVN